MKDHLIYDSLPVKIKPHINESCFGFVMRIATANAYSSPYWVSILEPCLRFPQHHHKEKIAEALIRLIGLSRSETGFLEKALLLKRYVPDKYYSRKLRVCPECLKKNRYLDYMWEVAFTSACPFHGIQLLESCPECLCELSWGSEHLYFCKCGAYLTEAPSISADARLLYYNTKIWAAMGRRVPKITLPNIHDEIFNKLNLHRLCDIYQFMFQIGIRNLTKQKFKYIQIAEAVQIFDIIHSMLTEWPLGLYKYLDSLRNEDRTFKGEGLQQAFGAFYIRLYESAAFKFIEEAFEAYVRSHWTGVIDGKYRRISSPIRCGYTLIGTAARKVNVSRVRLNKLLDLGIIVGNRKLRPSGRRYTVLTRCEVTRFAKIAKYMINKKETCSMLGISKSEFEVLVENKVIKPIVKAGDRGFSEWWCDSRKLKEFLGNMLSMVPKQKPGDNAISFSKVCQAHLTNINLLPYLLQSIFTGQTNVAGINLNASDGEFRLSSLYFDPDEIARFRQNLKKKNLCVYSIPQAASMMGLKQEVAYHLVNKGFLKCHEDTAGFQRGRTVFIEDIEVFEETYIPLTEITRTRNQCPRSLLIMFARLGISPAIGGGIDGCRQVFYRRADLDKKY